MLNMLAADYNCAPELLLAEGVSVTEAAELPGRRSYPIPENPLIAVTLGAGVVILTSQSRLSQVDTLVRDRSRDEIFSIPILAQLDTLVRSDGQSIAGPYLRTVCSRDRFIAPAELPGVSISVLKDGDVASLYEYPGFHNALAYRVGDLRRDSLCVVAWRDGVLVGVAGANVDSPAFWQIGIDVVPDERGRGVGRAIVGRLTEAILDAGAIPYYSTTTTNIASRNLAQSLGFWPAWTEIYVTDLRASG
jgi:GNAT superfamily N-acetyltransferase